MDTSYPDQMLVTPGQLVTNDPGFMRGHGTYAMAESLVSSVAGYVDRVNKLVSVKALRSRYTAEIGDVVVGRIIEIGSKRWWVDCNSRQDSALLLSSIHLPGAIQAEVQMLYQDGAFGIHTRNLKYGKLVTGELVTVQSSLVKRSRSHFHLFNWGVEVILGLNGYIWVGKPRKTPDEQDLDAIYSSDLQPVTPQERDDIARTRNCITALDRCFKLIDEESITRVYGASKQFKVHEILNGDILVKLCP